MKDLAKKETALSKTMENLKEFGLDVTDDLMQTDLALGLAVKGLTSAGKGIGNLLGFGKKKEGQSAAGGSAGGDTPVGTEKMGADGYIYVYKGKQWVMKAGQKDKTTGKKLGNRIATKTVAAGLGKGGKATPTGKTTPTVSPMTGGGAATDATMGAGAGGGSSGGMGMDAGTNIGGMIGGLAGGLAGGVIAGITTGISKIPAAFVQGMAYLTAGLGIFALGMASVAKVITLFGGEEAIKLVMTNLADGLSAFNEVEGVNLGIVGLAMLPFAAGMAALTAVMTSNAIVSFFGGGLDFTIIRGLAESLIPFSEVDGTNLKNVGMGLEPLAKGVKGLAAGGILDAIGSFFTGTNNNDILTNLATALGAFEKVSGQNLKNTGEGVLALAEGFGLLTGAGMLDSIGKYFTGTDNNDILSKLATSLIKFNAVNGNNLAQIGSGMAAMGAGMNKIPSDIGGGGGPSAPNQASGGQTSSPMSSAGISKGPMPTGTAAILEQISRGEGTSDEMARSKGFASGYDVTLGYGAYGGKTDKPLSEMTLSEVQAHQKKMLADPKNTMNSSAVGKFQVVSGTLKDAMKDLGLDPNQKYDQKTQDMIGEYLLKRRGLDKLRSGEISAEQFQLNTSKEFASVADPRTGQGYYAGQRKAHTTTADFQAAVAASSGENLNMASTSVENAQMQPAVIVAPIAAGGGAQQQPKQSPPTPPAINSGRPAYASVAGANYRGFQVSDISA
jgi:muramidase (phage lysozyme)